ncbi:MAG TPA: DUF5659 domain-containing protein [Methylomirabilota bacterium]|nr:DUF5659 domain-containing protein [Methylomirabilota bacterium]
MKQEMNSRTGRSEDDSRQLFETSDLNLASFLRCREFPITSIKRQNGKTVFAFDGSAELRRAILEYANDGHVRVRSFCGTLRDLKGITGSQTYS